MECASVLLLEIKIQPEGGEVETSQKRNTRPCGGTGRGRLSYGKRRPAHEQ